MVAVDDVQERPGRHLGQAFDAPFAREGVHLAAFDDAATAMLGQPYRPVLAVRPTSRRMVGDQGAVLAQRIEAADDGVDPVVGGAVQRVYPDRVVRSDEVVREILETADLVTLAEVAGEPRETAGVDASAASGTISEIVRFPSGQLLAIASCALRAL